MFRVGNAGKMKFEEEDWEEEEISRRQEPRAKVVVKGGILKKIS